MSLNQHIKGSLDLGNPLMSYTCTVHKPDSNVEYYEAYKNIGRKYTRIAYGTDASTVILAAWNQRGRCIVKNGVYTLNSVLNAVSDLDVILEPNTILQVPNGYSGDVLKLTGGINNFKIMGGQIKEVGTPQRLWNAIKLHSSSTSGIWFNSFEKIKISNPAIAIKFLVDHVGGWINGNSFENLQIYNPNIFIDFDMTVDYTYPAGFNRNFFANIKGQSAANTTYGVKNIRHYQNVFIDVKFWDLPAGAVSSNIHTHACYTIIIGGIMTSVNFTDSGLQSKIIDQWTNKLYDLDISNILTPKIIRPRVGTSSIILRIDEDAALDFQIKPYADNRLSAISLWNRSASERFVLRKAAQTAYELDVIRQTVSGSLRPLKFRLHDVPNAEITEIMRIDVDKNVKFYQGMAIPTTTPVTPVAGAMHFDTATNILYVYNGTAWVSTLLS